MQQMSGDAYGPRPEAKAPSPQAVLAYGLGRYRKQKESAPKQRPCGHIVSLLGRVGVRLRTALFPQEGFPNPKALPFQI